MKILYLHQYFKIPSEPGGNRSYWMAKKLIERGHEVTMLTSSSSIRSKIEKKNIEGINVIYLRVPYNQKMTISKRMKSFISFMIKSTYYSFKEKKVDLVLATSTPLTIGFPALILKKLKNIPYVFEVRDLWPEVPIQMGGLNNKLLQNLAVWFEKTIYKNALHIIALSPGMVKGVLKYEKEHKVTMIPNMAKIEFFYPREKNLDLEKKLGLKSHTFKIIHFGALGVANGASYIIEAAKKIENQSDVEFVFIGGGSNEDTLKKECEKNNLNNVKFLGKFAMEETSEIVNLCDVSIVSFLDIPILYTNSPNKLFDSLSAGKPIIVNSAGWTKNLVEKNKCGFFVNPKVPEDLVDKINQLKNNKHLLMVFSENSRKLAKDNFDKEILTDNLANLISTFNLE